MGGGGNKERGASSKRIKDPPSPKCSYVMQGNLQNLGYRFDNIVITTQCPADSPIMLITTLHPASLPRTGLAP